MARKQKLKVFRTPAGFHDAYVAAPSRKAALEAWGSDVDLFARGIAELVTDDELAREPLEHPGTVIKRSRGTAEEQLAALPADRPRRKPVTAKGAGRDEPAPRRRGKPGRRPTTEEAAKTPPAPKPKPQPQPQPRPSREKLDAAERMLSELVERQEQELRALIDRQRALEQELRELTTTNERERLAAERAVDKEKEAHSERLDRWMDQQR
jgi:hypothetical protein